MRTQGPFYGVSILAVLLVGCVSTRQADLDSSRERTFRDVYARIGKGEMMHAGSPRVGQLLQAKEWLPHCTVWGPTHGGLGRGPFYPRITVHFYPDERDPQGWSPYRLTIYFSGRTLKTEQDAEAFLMGDFSALDLMDDPFVTGYLMADKQKMYEFTEKGSNISPLPPP